MCAMYYWIAAENRSLRHFQALHRIAATYCEEKLQQKLSDEGKRAVWEREQMYHLLVADKQRGIDIFNSLCNRAGSFLQIKYT